MLAPVVPELKSEVVVSVREAEGVVKLRGACAAGGSVVELPAASLDVTR